MGLEFPTDDVVPDTRQILHAAAADQHHGVLLKVVPDSRNVTRHFHTGCQTHPCDLSKSRIRLLRRRGINTRAHTSLLRTTHESRRVSLGSLLFAPCSNKLVYCWHRSPIQKLRSGKIPHPADASCPPPNLSAGRQASTRQGRNPTSFTNAAIPRANNDHTTAGPAGVLRGSSITHSYAGMIIPPGGNIASSRMVTSLKMLLMLTDRAGLSTPVERHPHHTAC